MKNKLKVELSPDINNKALEERKYTLTHSDKTGERFLFIRSDFAEEEYNKLRDEVVANWINKPQNQELKVVCTLYAEHSSYTEEERYKIFKRHMPRAVTAIVNGDKEYIVKNNLLDYDIYVDYLSESLPKKEYYGKVAGYVETIANAY